MSRPIWRDARRFAAPAFICLVSVSSLAGARTCPDGDHPQIDVREISLRYETSGIEATLSGLGVLGAHVAVSPKTLQQAAVATQKMNEFIKAVVAGFNACAITKVQYQEALEQLLPTLRGDAKQLEQFRQQLIADQKVDRDRFNAVLSKYERGLRRVAEISGKELDYERIEAVVDERVRTHVEAGTARVLQGQADMLAAIQRRLNELESRSSAAPLPTPQEIDAKMAALKARLVSVTEQAESEYRAGYRLIERYRFQEALPHLERAVSAVPLPEFYLALGRGYEEVGAGDKAERAFRDGITQARNAKDIEAEARLVSSLLIVVMNSAGRDEQSMRRFLDVFDMLQKLDRNAWPKALEAAVNQEDVKNSMAVVIGMLLRLGPTGSYDLVLKYRTEAVARYGEKDPHVAMYDLLRVMLVTFYAQTQSKLSVPPNHGLRVDATRIEALAREALAVNEAAYGPVHPRIGVSLSLLGTVLAMQRKYDSALIYMQRSLTMAEQIWGPDHVAVAGQLESVGQVRAMKGEFEAAAKDFQHARAVYERQAGPKSASVQRIDFQMERLRRLQQEQSGGDRPAPSEKPLSREPAMR